MAIHPELSEFPVGAVSGPLIGYANSAPAGIGHNGWHSHDSAQLFHVVKGSIAIDTEMGTFFAPPERAVWLPPRVEHQTRYLTETEIRYVYVQLDYARDLPTTPQVIQVTTLLRALILEFMSYPRSETEGGPAGRLAAVILDQLKMLPAAPCSCRCRRTQGFGICVRRWSVARRIFLRLKKPPAVAPHPFALLKGGSRQRPV